MWQQIIAALRRTSERRRARSEYACVAAGGDQILRDIGIHPGDVRGVVLGAGARRR